jgi:hypothetical protein
MIDAKSHWIKARQSLADTVNRHRYDDQTVFVQQVIEIIEEKIAELDWRIREAI